MIRKLREFHEALVSALKNQAELMHVKLILKQAGEYTGDPAADVQRILERHEADRWTVHHYPGRR